MLPRSWRRALVLLGVVSPFALAAEPLSPAAIEQELRSFATTGTLLHVAAHPDDENTQLITYFALGRGYRTAYLSLTRGDGGQNELGSDFDSRLGLLRTQELLAARRVDHGRQFFTRAIDFGFSKTPEETLRFWDRNQVLGDVVRVIRQFRPDVIVTRFPIPPGSGGHGHHTASGILAVEAFDLAGDPKAFPEQLTQGLTVWQPKRVVWNSFSGRSGGLDGPTIKLDIAGKDPVTGDSFGTIANRSRGMHKTQGLGQFSGRTADGPSIQSFMTLKGDAPTSELFEGVDTTWNRVAGGGDEIVRLASKAIGEFKASDPAASVPALLELRKKLAALPTDPLVADKRVQLDLILQACLGLDAQATLDHADIVPGEAFTLHESAVITSNVPVRWLGSRYPGSVPFAANAAVTLSAGKTATRDAAAKLSVEAPLTQPYWLRNEPTAGLYTVTDASLIGRPENPPAFPVEQVFEVGGQTLVIATPPFALINSEKAAARRNDLEVVAPASLAWAHPLQIVTPGGKHSITLDLVAARPNVTGKLELEAPAGWTISPTSRDFTLGAVGTRSSFTFELTAPAQPSSAKITARAAIGPRRYHRDRIELRYDHLPVQLLQTDSVLHATAFPVTVRARKIGYLPGAGDATAESLALLGHEVTTLTGADLTPEKLAKFDAVVIGVRAFNERSDLTAALPGLFRWVESGGTVVAQYNRPGGLTATDLGPYTLSIDGPAPALRVTDETAAVTFLQPDHPALNTPNKITSADFDGWVQERGAYFASKWDDKYVPILAMNDPRESPLQGSLLVARHGKGWYVYTSLAFFRQLPAGVPGAHRLFENLVSLGK